MKKVSKKRTKVMLVFAVIVGVIIASTQAKYVEAAGKQYVTFLKVDKSITVEEGEKVTVKPTVKGTKKVSKKVTVESKSKKIAKVSYNAKKNSITITGIKEGNTTITVTTKAKNSKGKKISKKIKVKVQSKKIENTTEAPESTTEATAEKSTEAPAEKSTEAPTETKEETPATVSGDGWNLSNDGILRLSKIYYSVVNLAGNNYCAYETPWGDYENQIPITEIIIDADMVYKKSDADTAVDLTEDTSFMGGGTLFGNMDSLTSVYITRLNLDKITDISNMFVNDANLVNLDVSGLDLSGVQDASSMFMNDTSLTKVDLQKWNVSSLTTVASMFAGCTKLNSVLASSWNTTNIKDFSHMFENCSSLASINLSEWTINDADVTAMFFDCNVLSDVTLSNVTLQNTDASNAMFNENNSISSYHFADDWEIYEEEDKCIAVILDSCEVCVPTETVIDNNGEKTAVLVEYVYYAKEMPSWYKRYVEFRQSINEWNKIYESEELDIYVYAADIDSTFDSEAFVENNFESIMNVILRELSGLENVEAIEQKVREQIKNHVDKLDMLSKIDNRSLSHEDIVSLMKKSVEELQSIIDEQNQLEE